MAPRPLDSHHPDYADVSPVVAAIVRAGGGQQGVEESFPLLLRQAIDEVIDTPRTGRFLIEQTEKTEKTYLGTKVEILLRNWLKFPKGSVLDMNVGGTECDIKNTMHYNWTIPRENVGRLAMLVKASEKKGVCSLGVAVMRDGYLNPGKNQDQKRTMSAIGQQNIWWIVDGFPYPVNFWRLMTAAERDALMRAGRGTARLTKLFETIQRRPISRNQVQDLAQQHDYMKRLRANGGARDRLRPKKIALLSGAFHQMAIKHFNLGPLTADEFISVSPRNAAEEAYLRAHGFID
jgi:hypothetical protein